VAEARPVVDIHELVVSTGVMTLLINGISEPELTEVILDCIPLLMDHGDLKPSSVPGLTV
jgi:hypothetical protein